MAAMKFDKLSQTFAHRKMGAYWRCQEEVEKIKEMWLKDLLVLVANVQEKWGPLSNTALIQNKIKVSRTILESQVRDLLKLLDEDYQRELLRITASLGGRVEGKRVVFPDQSEANMPQHLTIKDEQLRGML